MKCSCPEGCKYCGRLRSRDAVGHYCKTRNCPWQHGYAGCTPHKSTKRETMKLLALDPGNTQTAFVILDGLKILDKGLVLNETMLELVLHYGHLISGPERIDVMAVEMIASYGMPVGREVFETCLWIGRFVQAWTGPSNRPYDLVYRKDVKKHVCMNAHAKDSNIRQALLDKIGPLGTKKQPGPTYGFSKDMWAALAVGVTWQETVKTVAQIKKPAAPTPKPKAKAKPKPAPANQPRLKPRKPPEFDTDEHDSDSREHAEEDYFADV